MNRKEYGILARNNAVRRAAVWAMQIGIFAVSAVAAFLLRFDFTIPPAFLHYLFYGCAIWIPVKLIVFGVAKLDRGLWRYVSIIDVIRISTGNLIASAICYFFNLLHCASRISAGRLCYRLNGLRAMYERASACDACGL